MKKKRLIYWIILAALLIINTWIILHRNEGYRYLPYKTYSQLYTDDSMLFLKNLEFKGADMNLLFSQPLSSAGYKFTIDSSPATAVVRPDKNAITIQLKSGIHSYNLAPIDTNALSINLTIDHAPNVNELINCNLPGPQIKIGSSKTWSIKPDMFPKEDADSAVALLKKYTRVFDLTTDLEKAKELSRFVTSLPNTSNGIPQGVLSGSSPLKQIQESLKCNAELACGNYTAIYFYLATFAGLKTRTITFRGGEQSWAYAMHYYNEVYLAEHQQWAVADPLYNIYFPFDDDGRFYNAADIKKMVDVNSFNGKKVYTVIDDSLRILPYDSLKTGHIFYHSSNADMCYMHPGMNMSPSSLTIIIEFYSFSRDSSYYSDVKTNDWFKIVIKIIAAISLLIVGCTYLFYEVIQLRKRFNSSPSPVSRNVL